MYGGEGGEDRRLSPLSRFDLDTIRAVREFAHPQRDGGFISKRPELRTCSTPWESATPYIHRGCLKQATNYFVGAAVGSAVAAAVGSAPTTLNFTSRHLPLSFGSQTFMSRFSIFAWNVPGSNMSFGLSGMSS